MKRITIIWAVIISGMLVIPSCDIVDEPYLKPAGNSNVNPTEKVRKVLLEDFTGHKCPNCPEAADEASNLKAYYKEQLVLLTIHAGTYSTPDESGEFTADYETAEGTAIHDNFSVAGFGYPTGMVNRTEYKGSRILYLTDWQNAIDAIIDEPAQVDIELTGSYDEGTRTLTAHAETTFLDDLSGTYYICVFILESNIVSPQKNEQQVDTNYVHNHMLRASMNGTWGEPVGADGEALVDEVQVNEYNYILPQAWVETNCSLVAFVYDEATKEVLQAEELDLD